ncbi:MAG: radical SAM family heme chaperone HemW [Candidatus Eremiobacteraeota bacterium]|nr:radical SAM family heme chaperone HemW [Candidatus Eremiobacteraeota bacterium]
MFSVYVHLPFCPYICPYCDFAKWPLRRSEAGAYLAALTAEISKEPRRAAESIFFGGGTPNTYDAATIAALTKTLREHFAGAQHQEISIEVNPENVRPGDFETYVESGINRVSIGVQSFIPAEIATLGRRHTPEQIVTVVDSARNTGIRSVSLDLIFGVPGQTARSWQRSLDRAVASGVDHISTYGLTVEPGTPYEIWREREPAAFPNDATEAELYGRAMDTLAAAGFEQYEISNFAKPGHRCAHNENYWSNGEYVGLGVGAASYRDGVRSVHTRGLQTYIAAAAAGELIPGESERLEGPARTGEAIMLALRTSQGVDLTGFKERYGVDVAATYRREIDEYRVEGLLELGDGYMRLTRRGRFLANDVCAAFVAPA